MTEAPDPSEHEPTEQGEDVAAAPMQSSADATDLPEDPDELRSSLRVQLVPEAALSQAGTDLVHRPALPEVAAVLVVELPDRVVSLSTGHAAELGDEDALWEQAFEQVLDNDHPDIDVEEPTEGVPIMVLTGPGPYTASHALWADRFLDAPGEGLLVAVPHRHLVLVHAIRDSGVTNALPSLVLLARHHHDSSPDPVSPILYWMHDTTFERIDMVMSAEADEMSISLPEGLARIVQELSLLP